MRRILFNPCWTFQDGRFDPTFFIFKSCTENFSRKSATFVMIFCHNQPLPIGTLLVTAQYSLLPLFIWSHLFKIPKTDPMTLEELQNVHFLWDVSPSTANCQLKMVHSACLWSAEDETNTAFSLWNYSFWNMNHLLVKIKTCSIQPKINVCVGFFFFDNSNNSQSCFSYATKKIAFVSSISPEKF